MSWSSIASPTTALLSPGSNQSFLRSAEQLLTVLSCSSSNTPVQHSFCAAGTGHQPRQLHTSASAASGAREAKERDAGGMGVRVRDKSAQE